MSYTLPADVDDRPVLIDGAGTLGSRLAAVFAAGGSDVRIFDVSEEQREAARAHAEREPSAIRRALGLEPVEPGRVEAVGDLAAGAEGAWMIIEAIPERLELKVEVFGELDRIADDDAILCSNSSSLPSSQMIAEVERPERVLNTHYYQPPDMNCVELMSCGRTDDAIIAALMDSLPQYGFQPFHVRRESDGFIFNRIWAAIKRECIMVVEEGVADPEDVDEMWRIFTASGVPPFRLMDRVGLDVVLAIEEHYASVRPELPEAPRRLLREYIDEGRLGVKSGRGFYDPATEDA
jgi:3-hydroxybutyryl-CoA dehydrogenase